MEKRRMEPIKRALAAILLVFAVDVWAGNIDRGWVIFQAQCVACHNKDLKGNKAMAKKFQTKLASMDLTSRQVRNAKDEDLLGVISKGKGRMPSFSDRLTPEDRADVLAYVRSLRGLALGFGVRSDKDAALYAGTFFAIACSYCHGRDGRGNTGMDKVFNVKQHSMDLTSPQAQSLADSRIAAVISKGKGKMPAFSDRLTPQEMRAMVAHVRSLAGAQNIGEKKGK